MDTNRFGLGYGRLVAIFLALCLLWTAVADVAAAPLVQTPDAPVVAAGATTLNDEPLDCINPLKAGHIASSIAAIVPIPFFKDAADLAAYGLNLELKNCPPHLVPASDLVYRPAAGGCTVDLRMPIAVNYNALTQLDAEIIAEVLSDPELAEIPGLKMELEKQLTLAYGRFTNETYGSYVNIYGIQLPLSLSEFAANDWGTIGRPTIYHYNSDALITLRHSGERLNTETVRFSAGTNRLNWQADTLLSPFDYVYIPNIGGAAAAGRRAGKEGVVQALKNVIKEAIKEASEQGAKEFSKKIAKEIAKDVAKRVALKVTSIVTRVRQPYFVSGEPNATTRQTQFVLVIDDVPPTLTGVNDVTVEALEPGGISANKHIATLQAALTVTDNCDKTPQLRYVTPSFWPLNGENSITWRASDNGARDANGGVNETQAIQRVTVVDTKPPIVIAPPPVIMEATGSAIEVPLGAAQVFDVADLRPVVNNNAPAQFTNGLYRIDWSATDASGNTSEQSANSAQIVNIKAPGTNKPPTAFAQTGANTIQAIADEPVKITVRGQDGDATPDPLWFSIENQPDNGFFIAPLYPYFIDDYRMSARYSPQIVATEGEEFAWQIAADAQQMSQYMKSLCAQRPQPTALPNDFVSGANYMAVDDDGYTFLADNYYDNCDQNNQPQYRARLSLWNPEGLFVGSIDMSTSSTPVTDIKFDLIRGFIYVVINNGASNFSAITVYRINQENAAAPFEVVDSFDMMNEIENTPDNRLFKFFDANEAIIDSNNVLYALSREPAQGLALFQQTGDERKPLKLITHLVYNRTNAYDEQGLDLRFLSSMALDSQDNLYLFALHPTVAGGSDLWPRIYKFSAATIDGNGDVQPGALIGWLGKCDSGPNCDYINGRSIGYSCTDETCFIDAGGSGRGNRAGQFEGNSATYKNSAIAIDPNDVLYVADYENSRVQRFSPDGAVAGEANSVDDGSSFVLGDFGTPDNIAVNKNSFYILDHYNEIVHVFDAAVIHGIDEQSAWVEYQSAANYVGPDTFTFAATDGFRTVNQFSGEADLLKSAPATIAINVSRNHRPPKAAVGLSFTTAEDTAVAVTLRGDDLDNFGVQRDQLTFQIVRQPARGRLSGTGANLTYTPDADYAGEDSFAFTVGDDRFTSAPETVALFVTPVNDAPTVLPENRTLRSGAGYPLTLRATVVDAEATDSHTIQVDWGDGTVETNGQIGADSRPTGPILVANSSFTSTLTAFHTYSAGSYTINAAATDGAGAKGEATIAVTVAPMADLALVRQGSNVVSANQPTLAYELLVTHNAPTSGGVNATNVTVQESLGSGLRYRLAAPDSGSCTPTGQTLICALGALAPGATNKIRIVVDAEPTLAVGKEVIAFSTVAADTEDPIVENNQVERQITMVHAADFLVDSDREGTDANPGDGICATAAGLCTVRAAIQEANALPGKQRIALARGLYLLNLYPAGDTITVEPQPEDGSLTGDLDITGDLEILGLSADQTTLHANGGDRVIEVHNGAKVTIRDLMLTGGVPLGFDASGGALRNSGGDVTLARVIAIGNSAPNGGGAIHNVSGTLYLAGSALVENVAGTLSSGAVRASETVGSDAAGGAILNEATLTLANVTISGNQADQGGGLASMGGTVAISNGTLYANRATANGGGIFANNDHVRIENTILAGNSAGGSGPDCTAQIRSNGHNLFRTLADCTILGETASNLIDETVGVAALAAADGETYGHTPLSSSRAVDAGRCTLATDQRGVARPQGNGCDIGALELGGLVVVSTLYLPIVAR